MFSSSKATDILPYFVIAVPFSDEIRWELIARLGQGKGIMELGTFDLMVIPGYGPVYMNAGRMLYDNDYNLITRMGSFAVEGDFERLCDVFAQ